METTSKLVQKLTHGWRALPSLEVVPSAQALPMVAPEDARGLFADGAVYVVHQAEDSVPSVLGHELVGHAGLRLLHGEHWPEFMAAISAGAREGDPALRNMRDHVRTVYGELGATKEADEAAARLAELMWDPGVGPLLRQGEQTKRWHAAVRHLERRLLLLDSPADADEVRGNLLLAEDLLRLGHLPGPAGWCYRPGIMPTPKPMGATPPPRSLRESEAMLKAEEYRRNAPGEWKMVFAVIGLFACAALAAVCIGYWALLLLGIVRL